MTRPALIGLALALTVLFWPWPVGAQQSPFRLLGQYGFESGRMFQDTRIGGLSGLAYDEKRGVYYAIVDDRGEFGPQRFYTLQIDLDENGIHDVEVLSMTVLDRDPATPGIQPYERNETDMEDIQLLPDDTLLISSERDRENRPWVRHFALDGGLLGELTLPDEFVPVFQTGEDGRTSLTRGIRVNGAFEGIAPTPSGETLYLINEDPLFQDGPVATPAGPGTLRILRTELVGGVARATSEYPYTVDRVFAAPQPPDAPANNGVSAMIAIRHILPQYDLLTMERAYVPGTGNDVNLYGVVLQDATDVRGEEALPSPYTGRVARKTLLANITAAGVSPDNLEAVAIGPRLPNGKLTLLVMSDDNFSGAGSPQINQFILFEIDAP